MTKSDLPQVCYIARFSLNRGFKRRQPAHTQQGITASPQVDNHFDNTGIINTKYLSAGSRNSGTVQGQKKRW
ncbi:hypothetical protein [Roseibium sp. RKSG952]|uniref:hypothetical protein n=1 Tax=Roseibium sp. RKSG952 TaxID=2529384 RepID=UPI0012BC75BA|nr:hypothetical protein [Roseibium sp. RKSG952]MTH96826.1 hypothetical protein [Roseibium sp. RKSG952]